MLATVPTLKISSGRGSSTEASCCVERKIFLSLASASSSARTLASRPTINGVICCGKMTISRTGIIGTRFISCFSRVNMQAPELPQTPKKPLASLLEQTPVDLVAANHVGGHHEIAYSLLHRQVVHQLQHEVFEDHTQAARADFALKSQLRDGLEGVVGEPEAHIFELEQAL